MTQPTVTIENITDPAYVARARAQIERGKRNSEWLSVHWPDLLPRARGRFVAVAGQEVFVEDTAEEAWALAKAAHPEDDGAIMQYVRRDTNPRIYAHCW